MGINLVTLFLRSLVTVAALAAWSGAVRTQSGTALPDDRPLRSCSLPGSGPAAVFAGVRWPQNTVPFNFAANVTAAQQAQMLAAMLEITNVAGVHFVPQTFENDFVRIQDSPINSSAVGMQGGIQVLHVFNWNQRFVMVHGLMHVIGFWHEHQRPDRDTYVAVQTANVLPSETINFQIVPTGVTYSLPYDFDSVMHFGGLEASANGQPTLLCLPPNQGQQNAIGQRTHLSTGDLNGLRLTYGSAVPPTINTLTPGSVTSYLPVQVTIDGLLLDEVTRLFFDATQIVTFTRPTTTQIRFNVPGNQTIGNHAVAVESQTGRSNAVPLAVIGSNPPLLEGATVLIRGTFANQVRAHGDVALGNVLVGSMDNQPSILPGVISLGLGSQFTTLVRLSPVVLGDARGQATFSVVIPNTVPASVLVYLQSLMFDPNNIVPPVVVSNVTSPRTF